MHIGKLGVYNGFVGKASCFPVLKDCTGGAVTPPFLYKYKNLLKKPLTNQKIYAIIF